MSVYWIWLTTRPHCNAKFCMSLLEQFDTAENIWRADETALSVVPEMNRARLEALMEKKMTWAHSIAEDCRKKNIQVVPLTDPSYPPLLREIPEAPLVLYVLGCLPDFEKHPAVTIVGTRSATKYGLHAARHFAGNLAQNGCIIVSGMALGIDGTANRAAIEAGGQTVAVLGCGVDVCYPWHNEPLYRDIIRHGAVISEYPPGTEPARWRFPARNRIMTGLSHGTLVIEAPKKSGALISADLALEQGRDVFAVPGAINNPSSVGCNELIRQGGAELVQTPADILAHYEQTEHIVPFPQIHMGQEPKLAAPVPRQFVPKSASVSKPQKMRKLEGTAEECAVWQAVHDGCYTVDALVEALDMNASVVLTALTMLEVSLFVTRTNDGYRTAEDVQPKD